MVRSVAAPSYEQHLGQGRRAGDRLAALMRALLDQLYIIS